MIAVSKNKRGQMLFLDGTNDIHDSYLSLDMELEDPLETTIEPSLVVTIEEPIQTDGESLITELEGSLEVKKECS
jgi:hypothetical protein